MLGESFTTVLFAMRPQISRLHYYANSRTLYGLFVLLFSTRHTAADSDKVVGKLQIENCIEKKIYETKRKQSKRMYNCVYDVFNYTPKSYY